MIWTQHLISQWAEKTFGKGYSANVIAARANAEMAELITETAAFPAGRTEALEEIADVAILLYRLAGICGGSLDAAIDAKMATNVKRDWTIRGDGTGFHKAV